MSAYYILTSTVSKALFAAQIETLDNFKRYLVTKDDVDMEFMDELINGFKNTIETPKGVLKKSKRKIGTDMTPKKRLASAYTMFIQYQMGNLKNVDPNIKSGKELMTKAVESWGRLSTEDKARLKQALLDDPTLTSSDLVVKVLDT